MSEHQRPLEASVQTYFNEMLGEGTYMNGAEDDTNEVDLVYSESQEKEDEQLQQHDYTDNSYHRQVDTSSSPLPLSHHDDHGEDETDNNRMYEPTSTTPLDFSSQQAITTDARNPLDDLDHHNDNSNDDDDEPLSTRSKGFHHSLSHVQEEEEDEQKVRNNMSHRDEKGKNYSRTPPQSSSSSSSSQRTQSISRDPSHSRNNFGTSDHDGPLSPFSPLVRNHHRTRKLQQEQLLEDRSGTPELQEEEEEGGQEVDSQLSLIPCRKVSIVVCVKPISENVSSSGVMLTQQPQICLFPLITAPSTKDEQDTIKSPLSTTTTSTPKPSPTRSIMDQACAEESKDMIVVNPSAFGKCIPAQITLETAKLVAQVAQIESEDWARKYKFDNVVWPAGGPGEGGETSSSSSSLQYMAQAFANDAFQHHQGNVCFGYGGIGSGKTHNLFGSLVASVTTNTKSKRHTKSQQQQQQQQQQALSSKQMVLEHYGILGLTLYNMLKYQESSNKTASDNTVSCITLSLLEIVDEDDLRDLLATTYDPHSSSTSSRAAATSYSQSNHLRIRHPDHKGAVVYNLTQIPIDSIHDLESNIKRAFLSPSAIRSFQREGGRGHVIATIELLQSDSSGDLSSCTVLNFVDLTSGDIPSPPPSTSRSLFSPINNNNKMSGSNNDQRQTRRLNLVRKSVSGLRGVLRGLLVQDVGKPVTFRECTLTKLLQRSLEEPNVRVVLIATVCPLSKNHERTLQTLNYVNRLLSRTGKTAESPYKGNGSAFYRQSGHSALEDLSGQNHEVLKNIISDPRQRLAKIMTKKQPPETKKHTLENLAISTPTPTPPLGGSVNTDNEESSILLDDEVYEPHDYMEVDPQILNKILAGPTPKSSTSQQHQRKASRGVGTATSATGVVEKKDMGSIQRNLWNPQNKTNGSRPTQKSFFHDDDDDDDQDNNDDIVVVQENESYRKPPTLPPSLERKNQIAATAFPQQQRRPQGKGSSTPPSLFRKSNGERKKHASPKRTRKDRAATAATTATATTTTATTPTSNPFNHVLHQEENEDASLPSLQASSTITTKFEEEGGIGFSVQDNNDGLQASDKEVQEPNYGEVHSHDDASNEPLDYHQNDPPPTEEYNDLQYEENDLVDDDLVDEHQSDEQDPNRDYSSDNDQKPLDRHTVEGVNSTQDNEHYDITNNGGDQHDHSTNYQNQHDIGALSSEEADFGPTGETFGTNQSFNTERVYRADTLQAGVGDVNEIAVLEEAINEMRTKHTNLWESSSSSLERLRESYLMTQHQLREALTARQKAEEQVETIWKQHVEQQNEFTSSLKECEDEISELHSNINQTIEDKNAIERIAEDAIAVQDKLEEDVSILNEEVSALKEEAAQYKDTILSNEGISEKVQTLEEENQVLQTQNENLNSTLLQWEEHVKTLEKDKKLVASMREEDQKMLQELEAKQEALLKDVALYQEEALQLKSANEDLTSQVKQQGDSLGTTIAEKDLKIKTMETEVDVLRKKLDESIQLTSEKEAALSKSRSTMGSEHSRLSAKLNELKRELKDREIKVAAAEEAKAKALIDARKYSEAEVEIERLKADLNKLSKKKKADEDQIVALHQQCEALEAKAKMTTSRNDHSEVSLKHALEENIAQQETNERLQQIITKTRNERDTNQETLKVLEEQIESEIYARKKVEAENILLKTKLERSVGALEDLGDEIQSLKSSGMFTGTSNKDFLLRELEAEKQNSEMIRLQLENELRKARASRSNNSEKHLIKELQGENSMLRSLVTNNGNTSPTSRMSRASKMEDMVPWEVYEAEKTRRIKAEEVTTAMALRAKDGIESRNEEIMNLKLRLSAVLDEKESEISQLRSKLYDIEKYQAENHSPFPTHPRRHLHKDSSPF